MFESLRPWCRFPILVHPFIRKSGSGDDEYGDPVEYKGYPVEKTEVVTDKMGKEYVSRLQIYFPEEVPITVQDMISFPEDTVQREVRKLGGFFDGNKGKRDIWVVYL